MDMYIKKKGIDMYTKWICNIKLHIHSQPVTARRVAFFQARKKKNIEEYTDWIDLNWRKLHVHKENTRQKGECPKMINREETEPLEDSHDLTLTK